ncbi:MAG: restriction endonuclease [Thermoproteota archaeon]|nr:restriction endonuclease [Thermoproteota archaeon]
MSIELKAELVMAIRDYECEERQRWDEGIDFTASDAKSDDKILLRVITEPKSKSGVAGIDTVRKMGEIMKLEDYDKGVLISKRFSKAAKEEMKRKSIQMFSKKYPPSFEPQKLYLKIQDCINNLCKAKCGRVPEKKSDCKGKDSNGHYSCKIRLISDNAAFHFERGWTDLLKNDLMRLLAVQNSMNNQSNGHE